MVQSIGTETAKQEDAPRNPLLTLKSAISAVVESHDIATLSALDADTAREKQEKKTKGTRALSQALKSPVHRRILTCFNTLRSADGGQRGAA